MEVLIVGAGAMGRWFGESVDATPVFTDIDADAAASAADAIDGRVAAPDETYEVVCIAVPMSAAETAIAEYADRATEAIVDVTGAMAGPVAAMDAHAPDLERVSFHPLFAPENAPGNVAVVADSPGPATDTLRGSLAVAGNELFETTSEEHDRAMDDVQSGAHAAVLAYALATEDVPERFQTPISGGLEALVEQMTGNNPAVYSEIQSTFDGAEDVAAAAARIADADDEEFRRLYREAGRTDDE